jgi:hypothetical protein
MLGQSTSEADVAKRFTLLNFGAELEASDGAILRLVFADIATRDGW